MHLLNVIFLYEYKVKKDNGFERKDKFQHLILNHKEYHKIYLQVSY